jgi:AcrR family transcriptional regulator
MPASEAIRDAAFALYDRYGLPGLSMRRVAKRVDVTATALYRHFGGKDALVDSVADRGFALFAEDLGRSPRARAPIARILQIVERYRRFALRRPNLFRLMFSTPRPRARRFPADFAAHRSPVFDELRRAVEEAQGSGELVPGDPLELVLAVWAHAHGLLTLHAAGRFSGGERAFSALYRRSLRRLLDGLAP